MTSNIGKKRHKLDFCTSFNLNFRFGLTLKNLFKQLETNVLR